MSIVVSIILEKWKKTREQMIETAMKQRSAIKKIKKVSENLYKKGGRMISKGLFLRLLFVLFMTTALNTAPNLSAKEEIEFTLEMFYNG